MVTTTQLDKVTTTVGVSAARKTSPSVCVCVWKVGGKCTHTPTTRMTRKCNTTAGWRCKRVFGRTERARALSYTPANAEHTFGSRLGECGPRTPMQTHRHMSESECESGPSVGGKLRCKSWNGKTVTGGSAIFMCRCSRLSTVAHTAWGGKVQHSDGLPAGGVACLASLLRVER